jgi:uncharacterized protein (TIGR02596 family)
MKTHFSLRLPNADLSRSLGVPPATGRTMHASSPSLAHRRAFSLVELIMVIAIIGIIATFVTPAAVTIIRGSQVTQASQILTDQISAGRQIALSKNKTIEMRFIRYADPEAPGEIVANPSSGKYRAIQVMEVTETGVVVPLGPPATLPSSVMISDSETFSSLMAQTPTNANGQDPLLPRNIKDHYQYQSFRFYPDGSTDLAINGPKTSAGTNHPSTSSEISWFVSMYAITDQAKVSAAADFKKVNFFTLQIDPISGGTVGYRPTAK